VSGPADSEFVPPSALVEVNVFDARALGFRFDLWADRQMSALLGAIRQADGERVRVRADLLDAVRRLPVSAGLPWPEYLSVADVDDTCAEIADRRLAAEPPAYLTRADLDAVFAQMAGLIGRGDAGVVPTPTLDWISATSPLGGLNVPGVVEGLPVSQGADLVGERAEGGLGVLDEDAEGETEVLDRGVGLVHAGAFDGGLSELVGSGPGGHDASLSSVGVVPSTVGVVDQLSAAAPGLDGSVRGGGGSAAAASDRLPTVVTCPRCPGRASASGACAGTGLPSAVCLNCGGTGRVSL
jgi:hypothetical protein